MGLPLYIAPVESDLRNKNSSSRSSPAYGASRIRRMRRRSTEALRESRRRAILSAAAAYTNPVSTAEEDRDQLQQQRPQHHEQQQQQHQRREREERDRERERERERDRARLLRNRELHLGSISNPARERLLQRFLERIREHEQEQATRLRERASGNDDNSSSNNNNNNLNATGRAATGANGTNTSNADVNTDGRYSWRDSLLSTLMSSSGGPSAAGASASTGDMPSLPNDNGATAAADSNDSNSDEFNNHLLAVLNHEWAEPPVRVYHHETPYDPSPRNGEAEQPYRPTMDHFLEFDETDGDVDADAGRMTSRRAYRRASSLRRVTNASSSSRRPTVGWSDNNDRPASQARGSSTSTSRIFGDINQIRNRTGAPAPANERSTAEAATARRRGWTVRYLDANNNQYLPSIRDLFGNSVDGLGDRRRSLSPEGDGAWDTLLTTLTPDPQAPSVGSSFASSSSALAAATAEGRSSSSSSQPTVTLTPVVSAPPAVPSPAARNEDADEDEEDSTPAPLLVETLRSQADAAAIAARGDSASAGGVSSGTTSASASQRIRSPFTVVSADTDTADESIVLDGVMGGEDEVEPGCEDSEMDDGRGGGEDDDDEVDEEEDDEEEQAAFLGLSTGPSALDGSRSRSHIPQSEELTLQIQRIYDMDRERALRTGFGGIHSEGGGRGGDARNNNTEEALDLLGIGGMQHIVRSLARREDIPDEWWAEAGLSRTLPREASS